jgi:SsrA-binding protein
MRNSDLIKEKIAFFKEHDPSNPEIAKLEKAVSQEGLTIVPIKAYFDGSYLKLTIAEAKGKKTYDKRESIKQKDIDRRLSREQF